MPALMRKYGVSRRVVDHAELLRVAGTTRWAGRMTFGCYGFAEAAHNGLTAAA